MNKADEHMGYKCEFPFDFGRGVVEQCRYYPEVKELHVATKDAKGAGKLIKMNPDLMQNNPSADMQFIWDVTIHHRTWYDKDCAGEEPGPAPPGILDNEVPVPEGQQPSIPADQQPREMASQEELPEVSDADMMDDPPPTQQDVQRQQPPPGAGNGRPAAAPVAAPEAHAPMISIPLTMYIDGQTLIEMLMLGNETLTEILERTVEPDSVDMAIINLHQKKLTEYKERYHGETSTSDSS